MSTLLVSIRSHVRVAALRCRAESRERVLVRARTGTGTVLLILLTQWIPTVDPCVLVKVGLLTPTVR